MKSNQASGQAGDAFTCPHCEFSGRPDWRPLWTTSTDGGYAPSGFELRECPNCGRASLFDEEYLLWPALPTPPVLVGLLQEPALGYFRLGCELFARAPEASAAYFRFVLMWLLREAGCAGATVEDQLGQFEQSAGHAHLRERYANLRCRPADDGWVPTTVGVIAPGDGERSVAAGLRELISLLAGALPKSRE